MASAAKSINAGPTGVEAGQIPLPGTAEMFAAMVSVANEGEAAGGGAPVEVAPEEMSESPEAQIDASVLLPMLDQQRAAMPAAKLVGGPIDSPSPGQAKVPGAKSAGQDATPGASPLAGAMIAPTQPAPVAVTLPAPTVDTKFAPEPVVVPAPIEVPGPAPVMRTLEPAEAAKPDPAVAVPAMRPIGTGKADRDSAADLVPIMRPVVTKKAGPAPSTDKIPVMRPIDPAAPKAASPLPASPTVRLDPAVAKDGSEPLGLKIVQPAIAPAPAEPSIADQPLLPAAAAKPNPADVKAAPPEVQMVVADAQAAPVAAKARVSRASVAPGSVEALPEAASTTPAAATATETRAAVQPLHAAPSLVQPVTAPAGAPVPNVAAALSQQVLDMTGGDAWIEQIARDISQTAGKDGTMRFRLAPETLGELKVEISHSERGAHVRLSVTSESAQQALAAAEHKLAAEARAQGVRIAETEINFTGGQQQSRDASAFAREQGQQQAQANQPRTPRGASANSFTSSAAAPEGRGRTDRYA